jgi:hypothetical protein
MSSINLSEIFNALEKTIKESDLNFDKQVFLNELKVNIKKDITPLIDEKNIKIIEKKPKNIKLSKELDTNLSISKKLINPDDFKKIKLDTLKDFCKVNGIQIKSNMKKQEIIEIIIKFNKVDENKTSKYFTIKNENLDYEKFEENINKNNICYKNNNFFSNITKIMNNIKRFSDDILEDIYYQKTDDYFVSICKDKSSKNNYFVYLTIDSSFKTDINKNYIIEIKQIKGSKDFIKVF